MRRLVSILALSFLAGCSREPTPLSLTGEQLMVHSLLVAGSDTAQVLVTRTLAAFVQTRPVSAADVRLVYDGTTLQLSEAPDGFPPCFSMFLFRVPRVDSIKPGCYAAAVPERIRPGQRYRLEVRVNGGTVEGETRVPAPPEILELPPGSRFPVALGGFQEVRPVLSLPVAYRVPPEIAGVRVTLAVDSLYHNGQRIPDSGCTVQEPDLRVRRTERVDSMVLTAMSISCFRRGGDRGTETATPDSIFARVIVAGYDSTYVRYAEAAIQDSAERERLRAGVTGALGVFAGAAIAERPVTLIATQ